MTRDSRSIRTTNGHRLAPALALAIVGLGVVGVLGLGSGCAAIRKEEIHRKEDSLIAAGFRLIPADTPERIRQLGTMPPNKLVARPAGDGSGKVYYVYADPKGCKCLYVGGPEQYRNLEKLRMQQEVAAAQIDSAMAEESAAMDMEEADWGPMVAW